MPKIGMLLLFLFVGAGINHAQTTVEPATTGFFTPEELIYQVFLGSGIEVLDVQHTGNPGSVGFFSNAENDIRINEGILMSTGMAIDAQSPNSSESLGIPIGGVGTDTDLEALLPPGSGNLNDLSIYEITFEPSGDTIRFNYVFASEEYPEFACTAYNDVFGFFLTGPNPAGGNYTGENIALVPDPIDPTGQTFTNIPVTINNVNEEGLIPGAGCDYDYSNYYNDNPLNVGATPTYDAFLDVFTSVAVVIPCEEYTIKLAVADVGDGAYDTAIFLEGRSFGGGIPEVSTLTVAQDGVITEGCADGSLEFGLPFPATEIINYTFDVIGSATPGADFEPFPNGFTLNPGDTSFIIPITVFQDGIAEGQETIGIDIQLTPCRRDTFYFYIEEEILVPPNLPDMISNCNGPVTLDGTLPIALPEPDTFVNMTSAQIPIIPDNNPPAPGTILPLFSEIDVIGVQPLTLQSDMILEVCVNITKPLFTGDLDLFLFSPDGKFIELSTDNGAGAAGGYMQTCFTPTAAMAINDFPQGQAPGTAVPFTGNWLPENSFGNLFGSQVNGTWTLAIKDDTNGFIGTLLDWRIVFENNYSVDYNWSPAAGLTCTDCPITIADPSTETWYYLSVTDIYGCEVLDSVLVNQGLDASPVLMDSVSCFGGNDGQATFELDSPGTPPYTFEWVFDGSPDSIHGGLTAGIYEVNYSDAGGCSGSVFVTVPQPTGALSVATTTIDLCAANSGMGEVTATPSGGSPGYTYQWDANAGNAVTQTVSNLGQGIYSVTVRDANLCEAIGQATINVASPIMMSLTGDTLVCPGEVSPQIEINSTGGNNGFTYNWSDGLGTDSILTNVPPGNYTVTATDAGNCTEMLTVNILDAGNVLLDLTLSDPLCPDQESGIAQINSASLNGNLIPLADLSITWSHGQGSQTSRINLPGDTDITITILDANGCTSDSTFQLINPSNFTVDLIENTPVQCFGESNGVLEVDVNGGVGNLSINWVEVNSNNERITDLSAGDYTLEVIDDGLNCLAWTQVFTITEPMPYTIQDTASYVGCLANNGGFATLAVTSDNPPVSITWSNGQMGTQLDSVMPDTFFYDIIDANGCDTSGMVVIPQPDSLEFDVIREKATCKYTADGRLTVEVISGTPPYSYSIDSVNFITNPVFVGLTKGNYTVTVRDGDGCEYSSLEYVGGPSGFEFFLVPHDTVILLGETTILDVNITNGVGDPQFFEWQWGPFDSTYLECLTCIDPLVEGLEETRFFSLTLIDEAGCIAENNVVIKVDKPRIFDVPTGFTPNGDSFNDLLQTHGDDRSIVEEFRVYDRWGTLVYELLDFSAGDPLMGWDGQFRGVDQPSGLYVWYATVKFVDGQIIQFKGESTLIR